MKTGKTLQELAIELARQKETKRDFIVGTEAVSYDWNKGGTLTFELDESSVDFNTTAHADDQIAEHIGIPKKYFQRMAAEAPELLSVNVNHWFETQPAKRMVRTLDGRARAFLSEKYRPMDNYDLVEAVLPEIEKAGCQIMSCDVTDLKLYIKAVSPKISYEVPRVGDLVQGGIVVSNSEIGNGALNISPLLYTLRCTNGMIADDGVFRRTHVGRGNAGNAEGAWEFFKDDTKLADDRALWLKVRDTVANSFDQVRFAQLVTKLGDAAQDRIQGDPFKAVEIVQASFGLLESEKGSVMQHLLRDGDMSRYGMLNAITRTAEDVESYDRATELERMGGLVLELPKREWERIATA